MHEAVQTVVVVGHVVSLTSTRTCTTVDGVAQPTLGRNTVTGVQPVLDTVPVPANTHATVPTPATVAELPPAPVGVLVAVPAATPFVKVGGVPTKYDAWYDTVARSEPMRNVAYTPV